MDRYREYKIQIKMFGSMQLENQHGLVKEPGKESETWKILKYLLVKRGFAVSQEEMLEEIWQSSSEESYGSFRVRLSRLRAALKDIRLNGKNGLLLCDNGLLDLNPEYDIQTDVSYFDLLMERIRNTTIDDEQGLVLCAEALTLYRGDYLGKTQGAWLEDLRAHYRKEFRDLVQTTLERMRTLQDTSALSILSSRAVAILPEDEALRNEVIRIAAEIKQPFELNGLPQRSAQRPVKDENETMANGNKVQIRLFGRLELKNRFGQVEEPSDGSSQTWLILKYLLVNRERDVSQAELLDKVWTKSEIDASKNIDVALRVALNRLRQELKPLRLDGKNGLINYSADYYSLNLNFELNTDVDLFADLINRIRNAPLDDPNGLVLCVEALELFRGKFLENTKENLWLKLCREQFGKEFSFLAYSTLERMETLRDWTAISLLSRRAVDNAPEEMELHEKIIHFMAKQDLQEELLRHMTQWKSDGYEKRNRQTENREEGALVVAQICTNEENAVAVTLFGSVELKNQYGCVAEQPEQTPEIWILLKYLLIHRDRELTEEEIAQALLQDVSAYNVKNTFSIRRRRLRNMLEPMHLGGTDGLILFENGIYRLNPNYVIYTDEDRFHKLMLQSRETPENDPDGLNACVTALTLYQGEFMQYTQSTEWIENHRQHCHKEFCRLVHDTFRRMRTLDNTTAIGLLGRRIAAMLPEAKKLHQELIMYMIEQNRQVELEEFMAILQTIQPHYNLI